MGREGDRGRKDGGVEGIGLKEEGEGEEEEKFDTECVCMCELVLVGVRHSLLYIYVTARLLTVDPFVNRSTGL